MINIKSNSLTYRYLTVFNKHAEARDLPTTTCDLFLNVSLKALICWLIAFAVGSVIGVTAIQAYVWYDFGSSGNAFKLLSLGVEEQPLLIDLAVQCALMVSLIFWVLVGTAAIFGLLVLVVMLIVGSGTIGIPSLVERITGKSIDNLPFTTWLSDMWAIVSGKLCVPVKYEK